VFLPTRVLVNARVAKIVAEAPNGYFCLLPRHLDFVTTLVPGILTYVELDAAAHYLAVDEGVLVKAGSTVQIATRNAVAGDDLARLRATVEHEFLQLDDRERAARSAVARLEAGVMRRFLELEERSG
jgi:F-type H+-transporting ATPase subunit epsilon